MSEGTPKTVADSEIAAFTSAKKAEGKTQLLEAIFADSVLDQEQDSGAGTLRGSEARDRVEEGTEYYNHLEKIAADASYFDHDYDAEVKELAHGEALEENEAFDKAAREILEAEQKRLDEVTAKIEADVYAKRLVVLATQVAQARNKAVTASGEPRGSERLDEIDEKFEQTFDAYEKSGGDHQVLEFILEKAYAPTVDRAPEATTVASTEAAEDATTKASAKAEAVELPAPVETTQKDGTEGTTASEAPTVTEVEKTEASEPTSSPEEEPTKPEEDQAKAALDGDPAAFKAIYEAVIADGFTPTPEQAAIFERALAEGAQKEDILKANEILLAAADAEAEAEDRELAERAMKEGGDIDAFEEYLQNHPDFEFKAEHLELLARIRSSEGADTQAVGELIAAIVIDSQERAENQPVEESPVEAPVEAESTEERDPAEAEKEKRSLLNKLKDGFRDSFWGKKWYAAGAAFSTGLNRFDEYGNTKREQFLNRGTEGLQTEEEIQKQRNKNRRNFMIGTGVVAVALIGVAFWANAAQNGGGSGTEGLPDGSGGGSGDVPPATPEVPVAPEFVPDPAFTIPEGGGGEDLLNRLSIAPEKWYQIQEQLLASDPNTFYRMEDGNVGIANPGMLPQAAQELINSVR